MQLSCSRPSATAKEYVQNALSRGMKYLERDFFPYASGNTWFYAGGLARKALALEMLGESLGFSGSDIDIWIEGDFDLDRLSIDKSRAIPCARNTGIKYEAEPGIIINIALCSRLKNLYGCTGSTIREFFQHIDFGVNAVALSNDFDAFVDNGHARDAIRRRTVDIFYEFSNPVKEITMARGVSIAETHGFALGPRFAGFVKKYFHEGSYEKVRDYMVTRNHSTSDEAERVLAKIKNLA